MIETLTAELTTTPSQPLSVLALRLCGAVMLCGMIGFERESRDRPAGLRTHMLVGLAASVYCLLMLELLGRAADYPDPVRVDPIRIIEAVTSGVAFLAAGMIVFAKGKVRGLTTGASLWLAASVGLSCGLGLWIISGTTTVLSLIIMRVVRVAETKAGSKDL
ncbi:MAG: MgtC/SapB family protein [Hoeflea sp.]|uniref:MgtC/SapB family protein n=1 Tax=Hoeflea sp. TaxID=1940281 RepID=UPI0032EDA001